MPYKIIIIIIILLGKGLFLGISKIFIKNNYNSCQLYFKCTFEPFGL